MELKVMVWKRGMDFAENSQIVQIQHGLATLSYNKTPSKFKIDSYNYNNNSFKLFSIYPIFF